MVKKLLPLFFMLFISACAIDQQGTIGQLRNVDVDIVDTRIEGGLEKAMKSYQRFLQQTPESAMTPDAIRRLADLNIEKEYGVVENSKKNIPAVKKQADKTQKIVVAVKDKKTEDTAKNEQEKNVIADVKSESTKSFEKRAAGVISERSERKRMRNLELGFRNFFIKFLI